MTYEEYVECLADLLSGDNKRRAQANETLYEQLVEDPARYGPAPLALVDAEAALARD